MFLLKRGPFLKTKPYRQDYRPCVRGYAGLRYLSQSRIQVPVQVLLQGPMQVPDSGTCAGTDRRAIASG